MNPIGASACEHRRLQYRTKGWLCSVLHKVKAPTKNRHSFQLACVGSCNNKAQHNSTIHLIHLYNSAQDSIYKVPLTT